MRAHELYESNAQSALDFAQTVLVPKFGFKASTKGFLFHKMLSDAHYITVRCSSYISVDLVNRKTMKSEDSLTVHGHNSDVDMSKASNRNQVLNKITQWTRQFSSDSPVVDESQLVEAPDLGLVSTTNTPTAEAIKAIQKALQAKGYKGKRTIQSAMFEYNYEGPGPRISIDGWHGNGKYGDGMLVFTLYVNGKAVMDLTSSSAIDFVRGQSVWMSEQLKQEYLQKLAELRQAFVSGSIFA